MAIQSRFRRFLALATTLSSLALCAGANAQTKVYVAPDDHTDYLWIADDAYFATYFVDTLNYYLTQIDQTVNERRASDVQQRWNVDGTQWMWEYERAQPANFARLMARVRDGHIGMPLNTLVEVHGGTPLEGVLRDMYYGGRLERRFNLRSRIAISMEENTLGYGLGSVYAGAGALYSWKGVCGCATFVQQAGDRRYDAYWWTGPDGSRILMKWQSLVGPQASSLVGVVPDVNLYPEDPNQSVADELYSIYGGARDVNSGPGGYAEARFPRPIIPFSLTDSNFRQRWPYDVIGLFGAGWDNASWQVPLNDPAISFPRLAQELNANPNLGATVRVSNQLDFFRDFSARYGAQLPSQGESYGNDWSVSIAAQAGAVARVRRSIEKLRTAEALAAIVSIDDPSFMTSRVAARDSAFMNIGRFYEHNWQGGPGASTAQKTEFRARISREIESYVDTLFNDARDALARRIPVAGAINPRFFVFNPLGWARSDYADYPYQGAANVQVYSLATNTEVPSQIVGSGPDRRLRILARNVPSLGYQLFEIRPGAGANFGLAANAALSGATARLNSSVYLVRVDNSGAITSITDKRDNRELVRSINGRLVNSFVKGNQLNGAGGTIRLGDVGAVSSSLIITSAGDTPRTTTITLYRGSDRIEVANTINRRFEDNYRSPSNQSDPVEGSRFDNQRGYAFSFNIDNPLVRHEEVGAVVTARYAPEGIYSTRAQNTDLSWLTFNHFADMSNGAGGPGVTISNWDSSFFKLGESYGPTLDTTTPAILAYAGGPTSAWTQYGAGDYGATANEDVFINRYALRGHSGYDQTQAMRFALEHQNPMVTGAPTGTATPALPATSFSLLEPTLGSGLIWAVKPAEDNDGVIVRFWNQANATALVNYTVNSAFTVAGIGFTSHIETPEPAGVARGPFSTSSIQLGPNRVATYKLTIRRR